MINSNPGNNGQINLRRIFISGPYKQCPNSECLKKETFGVFTPIAGSRIYSRECIECGYQEDFNFPKIKKTILYLDQFIISNLVKLLDKSHRSHKKIKSDPFWESLFIKLEAVIKSQAIICPDSFYHKEESLIGDIDFRLIKRLYEHFSGGKTLYPGWIIEQRQIRSHFKGWLSGEKVKFEFNPQDISFDDLNSWDVGLRVSVGGGAYPGQIENLRSTNLMTKQQLSDTWNRWQAEKHVDFIERIKEETLSWGRGLINAVRKFQEKRNNAMLKIASGENYNFDLDDIMPSPSVDLLGDFFRIAKASGATEEKIPEIIIRYFNDFDALFEIPKIKISSIMYAGLARMAALGKKQPPKSLNDASFISSYLPYCDALFIDKESAMILKEFPKNTPISFRLNEFPTKVFSLNNKEEFLDYLDWVVKNIPPEQLSVLKDIDGEDYIKPYWDIIEDEKGRLNSNHRGTK